MRLLRRVATAVAAALVVGVVGVPPAQAVPPEPPANNPPVAVPDVAPPVVIGTLVMVDPRANDSDTEGPLSVTGAVLQSGVASVALDPITQLVAITPTAVGQVVVGYTVTDSGGATASSTITVDVLPLPNQAPVAAADVAQMFSGGQVQVDPRVNDSDPDAEPLTIASAAVASGAGSVTTDGQTLTIGAAAGFVGPLVVTYVVTDPRGGTAQSTVTIDVIKGPNRAPVAVADSVSAKVGRTYRIPVLANDSDPDGDRITLVKVGAAKHGKVRRSGSRIVYSAPTSWTGSVAIRYTIRDSTGARAQAVLTIRITRRTPATPPAAKPPAPASGAAASRRAVESALARLGLPTGSVNGHYDARTRRALCAWRTITGRPVNRRLPTAGEAKAIVAEQWAARGAGVDGRRGQRLGHVPGGLLGQRQPQLPAHHAGNDGASPATGPAWGPMASSAPITCGATRPSTRRPACTSPCSSPVGRRCTGPPPIGW